MKNYQASKSGKIAIFLVIVITQIIPGHYCESNDGNGGSCDPQSLDQCIKMADPLMKEPKYVFPTTHEDVDHVCRIVFPQTWSEFIACIKSFTSNCLSNNQRAEFNRAIGDSINSVHKMCTNDDYKNAYLKKSECILEKAMSEQNCKTHYDKLITLIQDPTSGSELCCAHESFKLCITEESKECPCADNSCANEDSTQTASHFAKVIMENSLGFLMKQCSSQISPKPCVGGYTVKRPRFDPVDVQAESNPGRGSTYFPVGEERRPVQDEDRTTTTISSNDPRHPKEATTDEEDFSSPEISGNNFFGDIDNAGSDDPDTVHVEPETPEPSTSTTTSSTGLRYPSWLPDTEIKDFDEFLKNTLQQAGYSSQGLRSSGITTSISSATLLLTFIARLFV